MEKSKILEVEKSWSEKKRLLKAKIKLLTDNNLLIVEGKEDEILDKLQIKLGKSKEELKKIIDSL
ncbi:MAG: general stress protein CsbD [Bacteroidetes bacterium CG2_30_33_31]|nr:MAG: general stress protein CsbD [Bacteroidetes bacterium CG2_30_33_31]